VLAATLGGSVRIVNPGRFRFIALEEPVRSTDPFAHLLIAPAIRDSTIRDDEGFLALDQPEVKSKVPVIACSD
jgi:hypothetical protein